MQPTNINFVGCIYHVGTGIGLLAFVEEDAAIAALFAADEEDNIVFQGKTSDVGHSVCYLSADGVVIGKGCFRADVLLNVLHNLSELIKRHRGLGVETNVATEVELLHFFSRFDDDGSFFRLSHKAEYLRMTVLAEDDDLFFVLSISIIFLLDTFLQVQNHRTSGINQVDGMLSSKGLSGRRLTMSPKQNLGIMNVLHLVVIDGHKS